MAEAHLHVETCSWWATAAEDYRRWHYGQPKAKGSSVHLSKLKTRLEKCHIIMNLQHLDSRDTHKKIKIMNLLCGKSIVGAGGGSIMV